MEKESEQGDARLVVHLASNGEPETRSAVVGCGTPEVKHSRERKDSFFPRHH
jgi:hypothetical protein